MDFKGMTMNQSKGFTIIELLVVITIIAILVAIVLVNVTQYIAKGKDASIRANMSTILTNSAVYYENGTSTYTGFDTDPRYTVPANEITYVGQTINVGINGAGDKFCACATLYGAATFCVDSSGYKSATATACTTRCPDDPGAGAGVCID